MKFTIKHEIRGRLRVHMKQKRMTARQADALLYYLESQDAVASAKVYVRTADAVICYTGCRRDILCLLQGFAYSKVTLPDDAGQGSSREMNEQFKEKLVTKTIVHYAIRWCVPASVRAVLTVVQALPYIRRGISCLLKRKIQVPVLDAAAIGVSVLRGDYATASSVMFLLGLGETLEDWTHRKSVDDLARSMALNVDRVWLKGADGEVLVETNTVKPGDVVVVRMGNVIPFDGEVTEGEGMVNQSSLTGEPLPVRRTAGKSVYAGTVLEEGEISVRVRAVSGATRYEKIVAMIEDSEKLKSSAESKAEHLADKLVPYTLLGTAAVWLFTRDVTKTLAVLMVDFSCALKFAMPITVLSAIRDGGAHRITVKGGKFLEAAAQADTIVFDKTGTLTKASPKVAEVVSFGEYSADEMLRIGACLEEHFPHSMAKAVVDAAKEKNLAHEEMHTRVEYIVAHGIASYINDKRVVIGSRHFVFEDERCTIRPEYQARYDALPPEYSHLYLALNGVLEAVICVEDPVRPEAAEMIESLRAEGISRVIMMTGDSRRTAAAIARKVGVDAFFAEVLPEDKANYVEREKKAGRTVMMVGDGINDSPALSAADVGIAVKSGAEIAREIADITIAADDLREIVTLKKLANAMMNRIQKNYRRIVGINAGLIALGVTGAVQPTTTALLHNTSTFLISLDSMNKYL